MRWEVEAVAVKDGHPICFSVEAETRDQAKSAALAKHDCIIKEIRHVFNPSAMSTPVSPTALPSNSMAIWEVDCINNSTANRNTLAVQAASAVEAAEIVRKRGWLVLKVKVRNADTAQSVEQGICCTSCGSQQVAVTKAGFRLKGAAIGVALLGPAGIVGGLAGSNTLKLQCLRCGHQWAPGQTR